MLMWRPEYTAVAISRHPNDPMVKVPVVEAFRVASRALKNAWELCKQWPLKDLPAAAA